MVVYEIFFNTFFNYNLYAYNLQVSSYFFQMYWSHEK